MSVINMSSTPAGIPPVSQALEVGGSDVALTDEQQAVVDAVAAGSHVIVDACCGSGKTKTIQHLCALMNGRGRNILYLTYSRLLKADAQGRVGGAKVQNYHGIVYPYLLELGIAAGLGDSIAAFNDNFAVISPSFPAYDLVVIDEYQDINSEYAQLLRNIKSKNPLMQIVLVGDRDQKVQANTTLDAVAFAREFTDNIAVTLPFTRSFRMGEYMAGLLSLAWNKPIIGCNAEQQVLEVEMAEAVELMAAVRPCELLVLGKRNGPMVHALNMLEVRAPARYNKSTVYASIRDGSAESSPSSEAAVFTTYDASKGMERDLCVVFDYRIQTWETRAKFPNTDHEVLRNVFLVAASRGKGRIVFVKPGPLVPLAPVSTPAIANISVNTFTNLPGRTTPEYTRPFSPSTAFDFNYAENVVEVMGTISRVRLDDGAQEEISVTTRDGLIDLSPAVGIWQEALFFEGFDATERLMLNESLDWADLLTQDPWHNSLVLMAATTKQRRYLDQVSVRMSDEVGRALYARLEQGLDPAAQVSVGLSLDGIAHGLGGVSSPITFAGIVDAVHNNSIYELKFTSDLGHPAFLQAALYLVMAHYEGRSQLKSSILWNTRTGEKWEITVPDEGRFLNAVVKCVSKQDFVAFAELDEQQQIEHDAKSAAKLACATAGLGRT